MLTVLFIVAAVVDLALAALLIGVSGFIFGAGPESMHGGALLAAGYAGVVIACVVAPVAGFILHRRGRTAPGLSVAWLPPASALIAMMVPAPY